MIDDINKLSRKNIQTLKPYQSARRIGGKEGGIYLNANESPISSSFQLKKKVFNRYPECQSSHLISSYANYSGVSKDQILITRGADEGITLLMKAFCEPGKDRIIYCPPTYDMYKVAANIANIKIQEIPSKKNTWELDLLNIQYNLQKVKIIYICNPNNPTGNLVLKKDLISLLEITRNQSLVVIDEAYIEFALKESMVFYLKKYSNLVILRTLSKAFALAGIRCGFTLANKEIIKILNKVIAPYPIPIPVTDIAIQSLEKHSIKLMKNRVLDLINNRIWLVNELKNLSCVEKIFDSSANYVLVKFYFFELIFKKLWDKGIIVRNQNEKMNLKNCLRVTIGTRLECLSFIKELKKFCEKNLYKEIKNEK